MSGDAPASLISARKAVRFAQNRTDFIGVFACSMLAEALVLNGFGGAARSMLRRVVSSLDKYGSTRVVSFCPSGVHGPVG